MLVELTLLLLHLGASSLVAVVQMNLKIMQLLVELTIAPIKYITFIACVLIPCTA
jgi:hypothetical protein